MRILIVEDDPATARLYRRVLAEDGYAVDVAPDAEEARLLLATERYDGVVLDLGLRERNGLAVLLELRRAGNGVPVLVATGRGATDDVVRGLDAGADEYVVKPVPVAELRARVRALVRRGTGRTQEQLVVGNLHLNRLTREVRVGTRPVALTAREHALLEHLVLRAGETVRHTELLESVWDLTFDPGSNIVAVHVSRVRRKLAAAGSTATIVTVRGVGFVIRPEDSRPA